MYKGYNKCTCLKTHTSGNTTFEEYKIYYYKENYNSYSVLAYPPSSYMTYSGIEFAVQYTYLTGEFEEKFVDTVLSRQNRMDSIFED